MQTQFRHVLFVASSIVMAMTMAVAASDEWVVVGDAGNAPSPKGYGAVDYEYRIGKFEVTYGQYVEFLNAVAADDPFGLYDEGMTLSIWNGIAREGMPGSYTYRLDEPTDEFGPVNFVDFWDVLRYVNWRHNGKPHGAADATTTEDGAYTLTPATMAKNTVVRNEDAKIFLPSDSEWHKAAYYKGGGRDAGYWLYATQSDIEPSNERPPGGPNSANHGRGIGLYPVGSYVDAPSPYGTFDQTGNLWEWNETIVFRPQVPDWPIRAIRGGSFAGNGDSGLLSTFQSYGHVDRAYSVQGFRLGSIVPPACDLDESFDCDGADLNALLDAVGSTETRFDLTGDGSVTLDDRDAWLAEAGIERFGTAFHLGDVNLDGIVDALDLNVLGVHWLQTEGMGWSNGDVTGDGQINASDLGLVGQNWQTDIRPHASAVPEPDSRTGILLLLTGFIAIRRWSS